MLTPTANLDAWQRNLGADGGRKRVDVPIFHTPAEELAFFGQQNAEGGIRGERYGTNNPEETAGSGTSSRDEYM